MGKIYTIMSTPNLEKEEEGSAGFDNTGTLVVATDENVEQFIKTGIALARAAGYQADYLTDADDILKIVPDLNLDGVLGAGWTAVCVGSRCSMPLSWASVLVDCGRWDPTGT